MEGQETWVSVLVYGLGLGVPSIFILAGAMIVIQTLRFKANACQTLGTIVDYAETVSSDEGVRSIHYYPFYQYQAVDGSKVRAKQYASQQVRPVVGTDLIILVNPATPEVVRRPGVLVLSMGLFCLGVGIAALMAIGYALFFAR
jgi:hypothetical protein